MIERDHEVASHSMGKGKGQKGLVQGGEYRQVMDKTSGKARKGKGQVREAHHVGAGGSHIRARRRAARGREAERRREEEERRREEERRSREDVVEKWMVDPSWRRTELTNRTRTTQNVACSQQSSEEIRDKESPNCLNDETSCLSREDLLNNRAQLQCTQPPKQRTQKNASSTEAVEAAVTVPEAEHGGSRDWIKESLNDDEALALFEATPPSPSLMQVPRSTGVLAQKAPVKSHRSPRTPSNAASNLKSTTSAEFLLLRGRLHV